MYITALALIVQPAPMIAPAPMLRPTLAQDQAAIARTIADVYAVISGPARQARDWVRMKSLFTPDARMYSTGFAKMSGGTVDDYIAKSGPVLTKVGFTEKELARRVEIYGNLAQVWSSYHASSADGAIDIRGINSFQLARQADGRWLVHSVLWQNEQPAFPLPTDMEAR